MSSGVPSVSPERCLIFGSNGETSDLAKYLIVALFLQMCDVVRCICIFLPFHSLCCGKFQSRRHVCIMQDVLKFFFLQVVLYARAAVDACVN